MGNGTADFTAARQATLGGLKGQELELEGRAHAGRTIKRKAPAGSRQGLLMVAAPSGSWASLSGSAVPDTRRLDVMQNYEIGQLGKVSHCPHSQKSTKSKPAPHLLFTKLSSPVHEDGPVYFVYPVQLLFL